MKIAVTTDIPAECKSCPFYVLNYNETNSYYCLLKSEKATAQFGGINIVDKDKINECPLEKVSGGGSIDPEDVWENF